MAELRALAERQPELERPPVSKSSWSTRCAGFRPERRRGRWSYQTRSWRHVCRAADRCSTSIGFRSIGTRLACSFDKITEVLRRHDALEAADATRLNEIGRSATLPDLAKRWFTDGSSDPTIEMLDEVLAWSLRPFLIRTAEVLQQRGAFGAWKRGICPVCGGEPDFACITTAAERLLICGRCQTRWPTSQFACPFCGEGDKQRITSFATPDGTYRVTACQTCKRYLKTLDGRVAGRTVMPSVDSIATLPLDAVVMQRGFKNG